MTTRSEYHENVASAFLEKSRAYLLDGDLLQASEKGWAAAAQMVKAASEQRGWRHRSHVALFKNAERLADESDDRELFSLFHTANSLHQNFYEGWQTERQVAAGLDEVEEFVRRVRQLTNGSD